MKTERKCRCFRCNNILSPSIPLEIGFCRSCLLEIDELLVLFPRSARTDIVWLMAKGGTSLRHAAKILGISSATLLGYFHRNYISGKLQQDSTIRIGLYHLRRFQEERQANLLLSEAAARLGIDKDRIKYLARNGHILVRRYLGQKAVLVKDLSRIKKIDSTLKRTANKRRGKTGQRPRPGEMTTKTMSTILGVSNEFITSKMRIGRIKAEKRGWFWYGTNDSFRAFCESVVQGKENSRGRLIFYAQIYLDSLAPN